MAGIWALGSGRQAGGSHEEHANRRLSEAEAYGVSCQH